MTTNPAHYRTIFENDHVRVLDYTDQPGEQTTPHTHPNSVMITLTDFQRRLSVGGRKREVELKGAASGIVADDVIGPVA